MAQMQSFPGIPFWSQPEGAVQVLGFACIQGALNYFEETVAQKIENAG